MLIEFNPETGLPHKVEIVFLDSLMNPDNPDHTIQQRASEVEVYADMTTGEKTAIRNAMNNGADPILSRKRPLTKP